MTTVDVRTEVNPEAVLPRVNLIPASIHERARIARTRSVAAALLAGSFVVTGGLWLLAHASVADAQGRVDQANAQNTSLRSQAAKYAAVPQVQAQLAAAQAQLAGAMASDIRFSFLLNDLALTIPRSVVITQLTISSAPAGTTGGAVNSGALTGPLATGVGSITFQGKATSINAVADWLDKGLANSPAYANPFVTNVGSESAATGASGAATIGFTSSLVLMPSAYSHRFDQGGN